MLKTALTSALVISPVFAASTETIELSLDDLLNLEIDVGTLTGMSREKIPVSLTTITKEDIALTPARHILDLIEIYVPGSTWFGHSEMAHPGIRGVISDRNGKFLLLVNGRRMNQDGHDGAISEIENYDMRDIERVEVIRGPGSVTYGPGAIMGVVNIITKQAQDNEGFTAATFGNLNYQQAGYSLAYGKVTDNVEAYAYFSAVKTDGFKDTRMFSVFDSIYGYVGEGIAADRLAHGNTSKVGTKEASNYMADYWWQPQFKAQLDLTLFKEFRLQGRYTNSGNAQMLTLPGSKSNVDGLGLMNSAPIRIRQYFLSAENDHKFSDKFSQVSTITWNDQDFKRSNIRDTSYFNSMWNVSHWFSEKHLYASTLTKFSPTEKYKFALGAEYVRNTITHPWFENQSKIRLGDAQNMFGDTSLANPAIDTSNAKAPTGKVKKNEAIFVGDGWSTNTVSFVTEANLEFHKYATLLVSGRADKNTHSNWGFSPRAAWIAELNDQLVTKLIWQRSVRMNYAEQSYLENIKGNISDPEVLNGVEAIVNWAPSENLAFAVSGYYNSYDALGFSRSDTTTKRVGTMNLAGTELEVKYTTEKFTVGANHSFLKQIDYTSLRDAKGKGSGLSYADWDRVDSVKNGTVFDKFYLTSVGNNVNNWANNATKLYFNWKIINPLTFHMDTRLFWEFGGNKDGMNMYQNAANDLPIVDSVIISRVNEVMEELKSRDMYGMDFRLNASLAYQFTKWGSATIYCQNLLGTGDNKRYAYDAGDVRLISSRWQFIEEPRTYGINLEAKF